MHRVTTAACALFLGGLLGIGCQAATITAPGVTDGDDGGSSSDDPQTYFETQVQPILDSTCVNCHEEGSGRAPGFIRTDDYYNSVRTSGHVVAGEPESSKLWTYPQNPDHGTEWPSDDAIMKVRRWIELEAENGPIIPPMDKPETDTTPVLLGGTTNQINLGSVGLTGAMLTFSAIRSGSGIQLQSINWRGGETGIAASGPRFVVTVDTEKTVQSSSFVAGDVRVGPGETLPATASNVNLPDFPDGAQLSIQFDAVGPMM